MDKENEKKDKVEESAVVFEVQKPKFKGIDHETFDFDVEFAKGLTPEQAKAESKRRIREWWVGDFDTEFAKGLTPEEFKTEMSKRIKAYPWKNKS